MGVSILLIDETTPSSLAHFPYLNIKCGSKWDLDSFDPKNVVWSLKSTWLTKVCQLPRMLLWFQALRTIQGVSNHRQIGLTRMPLAGANGGDFSLEEYLEATDTFSGRSSAWKWTVDSNWKVSSILCNSQDLPHIAFRPWVNSFHFQRVSKGFPKDVDWCCYAAWDPCAAFYEGPRFLGTDLAMEHFHKKQVSVLKSNCKFFSRSFSKSILLEA